MKAFLYPITMSVLKSQFQIFQFGGEGWLTRNRSNARPIPLQIFVRKCSAKLFLVSVLFRLASMIAVKPVSPCFCVDLLKFL